ncbi:MAG: hypothetical protein ABIN18_14385 [Pseudomonadota bacterium]
MTELTEKIKVREAELGRPLTAVERLNVARSLPGKDDAAERMEIILQETKEGIEAAKVFHAELEKANLVNNLSMRHASAHQFETTKRDLLTKFNAGELERIQAAA